MSRFVKWVTLTPEERQQVHPTFLTGPGESTGSANRIKSHTCSVTLPNGQTCPVEYSRFGARSHRFAFLSPVHQRLWHSDRLVNSIAAIQEKAEEFVPIAFRLAQQEEQKQARRRTPPPGRRLSTTGVPPMKIKTAEALAGLYAVCVQFQSGNLLPVGSYYTDSDKASEELSEQATKSRPHGQRLVIGLCCRWERRWKVAQFAACLLMETPEPTAKEVATATTPTGGPTSAANDATRTPGTENNKSARKPRRKASAPPATDAPG